MSVEATQVVDDVMRRWPMTIRVFLDHRMYCVGCPISCFHTLADACREHGLDQSGFLTELSTVIHEPTGHMHESASGQKQAME